MSDFIEDLTHITMAANLKRPGLIPPRTIISPIPSAALRLIPYRISAVIHMERLGPAPRAALAINKKNRNLYLPIALVVFISFPKIKLFFVGKSLED